MNSKDLDDVDDDLFISKKPQNYIFDETKNKTTGSLINCKNLVYESEIAGRSALENLSIQREALERTENNLDSINAMNRITQKHLTNMRSFFGGIRSLFVDSTKDGQIKADMKGIPKSTTLSHLPSSSSYVITPEPTAGSSTTNSSGLQSSSASQQRTNLLTKNSQKPEEPVDEFEKNLDELGMGLGQLKILASRLGDEIEDQNQVLDRITDKTERAGDSIKHQNRHVRELLRK